jgi:small-conductance mechanosensitive channel
MDPLAEILTFLESHADLIPVIIILISTLIIFSIISRGIRKYLTKKVKSKRQISNVTTFLDLLKFIFIFLLLILAVVSYYGKWGEIGFIAGLLTVALGWALQKPISGVVAWLILIIRRPIHIGDRVIISNLKGDIKNITLTHIFLDEVGGTIDGEESSGRTVMIPTSIIFETNIINYTEKDEYILDEVTTAVTYESNLEKAEEIMINSVKKIMESFWEAFPKRIPTEPHTRLLFKDSGIDVTVRYYSIVTKRNAISTDIRREIFNHIRKTRDVEIAYPHAEVLFREKTPK